MPGKTPKGVPFSSGGDTVDTIDQTMQSLAEWVDARPGVSALTTDLRNGLTGADLWDGRVIWNVTLGELQRYSSGTATWRRTDEFGAPGASVVGDAVASGTAGTVARSDHRHGRESFSATAPTLASLGASALGTSTDLSRSDHVHGLPAALTRNLRAILSALPPGVDVPNGSEVFQVTWTVPLIAGRRNRFVYRVNRVDANGGPVVGLLRVRVAEGTTVATTNLNLLFAEERVVIDSGDAALSPSARGEDQFVPSITGDHTIGISLQPINTGTNTFAVRTLDTIRAHIYDVGD